MRYGTGIPASLDHYTPLYGFVLLLLGFFSCWPPSNNAAIFAEVSGTLGWCPSPSHWLSHLACAALARCFAAHCSCLVLGTEMQDHYRMKSPSLI